MQLSERTHKVIDELDDAGWFMKPGAYVMVDGQFGSTGKGLLASLFAMAGQCRITDITTNAAPNSGHTAYFNDEKIMTQQIPVSSVIMRKLPLLEQPRTIINAGAAISPSILLQEADKWDMTRHVVLHPHAALIEDEDVVRESGGSIAAVASTGKGVGSALSRKVCREPNVVEGRSILINSFRTLTKRGAWINWNNAIIFVETAQGYSLGINSGFYPYCTSRECTVQQAISDAHIPYNKVRKVAMCLRTFPIRVGNTQAGHSGDCYPDQKEIGWADVGVEPELTSVTKRVRRVFTWSRAQFMEAVEINQPDLLFLNFCNYLMPDKLLDLIYFIHKDYHDIMGKKVETLLLGFGPKVNDITVEGLLNADFYPGQP